MTLISDFDNEGIIKGENAITHADAITARVLIGSHAHQGFALLPCSNGTLNPRS